MYVVTLHNSIGALEISGSSFLETVKQNILLHMFEIMTSESFYFFYGIIPE